MVLKMFLHRSLKTALKNTENSNLYSILKLTFLEILKFESFRLSQFSRNLVLKQFIPFYYTLGLWHVPPSTPENGTQKPQNSALYITLKLTFPEIFKNESFRFPQFSRNFVFKNFHFKAHWASDMFLHRSSKTDLKNIQNSPL